MISEYTDIQSITLVACASMGKLAQQNDTISSGAHCISPGKCACDAMTRRSIGTACVLGREFTCRRTPPPPAGPQT
jgi:hypothetical protein